MATTDGHIELERSVASLQVGARHRHDLGDIDALAASIERVGLLQPITITPTGCWCAAPDGSPRSVSSAGTR